MFLSNQIRLLFSFLGIKKKGVAPEKESYKATYSSQEFSFLSPAFHKLANDLSDRAIAKRTIACRFFSKKAMQEFLKRSETELFVESRSDLLMDFQRKIAHES